jgi:hypothetical protein
VGGYFPSLNTFKALTNGNLERNCSTEICVSQAFPVLNDTWLVKRAFHIAPILKKKTSNTMFVLKPIHVIRIIHVGRIIKNIIMSHGANTATLQADGTNHLSHICGQCSDQR